MPSKLPHTTLLFHAAFALVLLVAWISLAVQVDVLIGSRGLLPAHETVEFLRMQPWFSFLDYPSIFYWSTSDAVLHAASYVGIALAVMALIGFYPRICFVFSMSLYFSYIIACDEFLAFQWDAMLIEMCILAAWMPRARRSWWALLLLRLLLFKLYFESGLAKLQSPIHDWTRGSAMTHYYQTAPIPTVLGYYAHHLPTWWHNVESQATLLLELFVPFAFFGPRRVRYAGALLVAAFQFINLLTANYGFFVWMSLVLSITLLDDDDTERFLVWCKARLPGLSRLHMRLPFWPKLATRAPSRALQLVRSASIIGYGAVWCVASLLVASVHFGSAEAQWIRKSVAVIVTSRLANPYHLFTAITTERVEPQFEVSDSAGHFLELDMHYKAGDPRRSPPFVAPHQPRVDFRLWFYGLSMRRGTPEYVETLLDRLCYDPSAVQSLFVQRLPAHPRAVRIAFYRYHFATSEEHARDKVWWTRRAIGRSPERQCD